MTATVDLRTEVRQFLRSRRARIAPQAAGLPSHTGTRRVEGLRREEVAVLAGISIEYYVRIERGNIAGTSERVLDALAAALQLDAAERDHLFGLARRSAAGGRDHPTSSASVRPALQHVLDAITGAPALIRNGRHDVLAMNHLARALFAPVLADARRPANVARFVYLHPREAAMFFVEYNQVARNCAAVLRMQTGRHPDDDELRALVNELYAQSEAFRQQWASQDVRLHGHGSKQIDHPVVGRLDLDFESLDLATDPDLHVNVYTAPAGSSTSDKLVLLASWADDQR
ncbi:MmyB family transcriptional regulator [Mycolicibacterium tokaiense]|uniref:XRE family transcriptional regulator n=1 Tax=Mycolicibacterium tokaiense TaxID=39695 RepID=A0A378T6Z8_9MYCO|nr:helix-turn-helix domain-containing protein [Mycolicibacterium tokaiense]BBY88878.1 transcriptional regulator [Mycolicibacterium tokaiense]STZ56601.1 XRE family transcriptional regulator [Mycolicibacterium tokaiense]